MTTLIDPARTIPTMTPATIDKVRALEAQTSTLPQVELATDHVLHGGLYARTITIPAGALITGVLIRVPTVLIVSGHCSVWVGEDVRELVGYHVLAASAGRKQAFYAYADTILTMMFATCAQSIAEAEDRFTDETHLLLSRKPGIVNTINITGE